MTELIILPEYAGQWVECPTCGFRLLGPHPAQPKIVAEARARAARAAAMDAETASLLAALSRAEPTPEPPPAEPEELPFAELVPEQAQVMSVLEMLVKESREAPIPPPVGKARRTVANVTLVPRDPTKQEAKAASALEELEKRSQRLDGRHPVVPEPPRRAAPPVEPRPGDLTPQETVAIDALEALAEATIPAQKIPAQAKLAAPPQPLAPEKPAAPAKSPMTAKPPPNRAAQSLALGAPPRSKKVQVANRPARAAAQPIPSAPARANHHDLVLTWAVSLAIAAAIVGTTVACELYDLALLGGAVFVGLPVVRTVIAIRRRRDDGLPY